MRTYNTYLLTIILLFVNSTTAQADMFNKLKDTLNKKAKEVVDEVKNSSGNNQRDSSTSDCDFPTREGCPTTVEDLRNNHTQKSGSQGERCFYGNVSAKSSFATAPEAKKVCISELTPILYPTKRYSLKDGMNLAEFPFDVFQDCQLVSYTPYQPVTKTNTFAKVYLECADNNAREIEFETQSGHAGNGIIITYIGYYLCAPDPNFKGGKFDKALREKYGKPTQEQVTGSTKPEQIMSYRWCASGKCQGSRGQDKSEFLRVYKDGRCNAQGYSQYKVELFNGTENYQKWRDHIQKISIDERQDNYEPDI